MSIEVSNKKEDFVGRLGNVAALTALPTAPWGWQPHASGSVFGLGALSSSAEQREPCRNPEPELGEEETLLAKEEGRVSKKTVQKLQHCQEGIVFQGAPEHPELNGGTSLRLAFSAAGSPHGPVFVFTRYFISLGWVKKLSEEILMSL